MDENLLSRAVAVGGKPTVSDLHELGRHIAMHEYLTVNCPLKSAEIDRLLQLQDPLEVAVQCTEGKASPDMDLSFLMDRVEPELTFPMAADTMPSQVMCPRMRGESPKKPLKKGKAR